MYKPILSIVTVCRNARNDLQRTVSSVKEQTITDYEYLIVDGGSIDGTVQWLATQKGMQWISEPDKGIYDAMNKGVQMAAGNWIIFMNAGDTFYSPEVLQQVIPFLKDPYGLVYGDIVKERNGHEMIKRAESPRNAHRMICCHQALFTRTTLLKDMPFDTSYRLSADFKFFKQMYLRAVPMLYIPVIIARFDTHGASNTHRTEGLRENIRVIKETDAGLWERFGFIIRLQFTILWSKLRHIL